MKGLPVLWLLLWLSAVYFVGIYVFVGGFLLVRLEVNRTSTCGDLLEPEGGSADFCRGQPRFKRAIILIIDALKIDFARFDSSKTTPRHYENKLPVLEEVVSSRPSQGRLYPFRADPPTTTMQRIKGFTTGSLPTFVDVGNNFASSAILEDNLIHQLGQTGRHVVFMGDDTWESLFPKKFFRSLPFPSFNVKDLHTVDNGILQHLYTTMVGDDWDVLVAHFLGVDHCGHRFGPDHPSMADKLTQMDGVIRSVIEHLQNDTLLVVMGDHGMTDTGDHGGESLKETDAALFLYSPTPVFAESNSQNFCSVSFTRRYGKRQQHHSTCKTASDSMATGESGKFVPKKGIKSSVVWYWYAFAATDVEEEIPHCNFCLKPIAVKGVDRDSCCFISVVIQNPTPSQL